MPPSIFVGRDVELAEGRAAVDAAIAGRGGMLLITGEPGIGKTRLADEFGAYAEQQGAALRWASCWDGEGAPAFWPFVQVLRADPETCALGVLDEVETAEAGGEAARFRLFDTVSTCMLDSARDRPLLVVIDDLQWADLPSLLLLKFLAQKLRGSPLLVVATARDAELAEDQQRAAIVAELAPRVTRLSLRGLDGREVGALLEATTGSHADAATAAAVHDHTDGNPFFVVQVARLLSAEGQLSRGASVGRGLPLPDDVRAVVDRRLARLSQPCHQLLEIAAVAGKAFDADVVAPLAGVTTGDTWLLDEAAAARVVLATQSGQWAFVHDLVRHTLYERLTASRRQDVHAAVGRALEDRYADDVDPHLAELAHHFLRAGEAGPGAKGTTYATRAGRRAMALLAYEEAVAHFERALDSLGPVTPRSAEERTALLLDLGEAHLWSGDWDAANASLNRAADLARERDDPHDLARAALGLGSGLGGFEVPLQDFAQVDLLEEALRALDGEASVLRARVLARLSVALAWVAPVERQIALSTEAVELCRRLGDDQALAYALSSWCDAVAGPDHVDERLAASAEMLEICQRIGDREGALLARRLRIVALLEHGDAAVDNEIEAFATLADGLGAPLYRWYAPQFRGCRALMAGRIEQAEQLLAEAESIGAQAQSENAYMLGVSLSMAIHREQGRVRESVSVMEAYADKYGWIGPCLPALTVLYAESGDVDRAQQLLNRLAANHFDELFKNGEWLASMGFVADAVVCLGDRRIAKVVYDFMAPYARYFGVDGILGSCTGCVGRQLGDLAVLLERMDEAVAHYELAIDANLRGGASFYAARTQKALDRLRSGHAVPTPANAFVHEGQVWSLAFNGAAVTVPDAKGLHDLAWLVAHPGKEIAAAELMGVPARVVSTRGDAVLDATARAAYKRRLEELEDDLSEAESFHDTERASRAREERDFLAAELAGALGLGGRERRLADPSERARKAVTMRIRNSVARIAKVHPDLARHLERSVRTGTFCSYEPEAPMEWHT